MEEGNDRGVVRRDQGGLELPSMTRQDLKLHESHPLQCCSVSLTFAGSPKDSLRHRIYISGADGVGQRSNRGI